MLVERPPVLMNFGPNLDPTRHVRCPESTTHWNPYNRHKAPSLPYGNWAQEFLIFRAGYSD